MKLSKNAHGHGRSSFPDENHSEAVRQPREPSW
jgi:hypothetical protein